MDYGFNSPNFKIDKLENCDNNTDYLKITFFEDNSIPVTQLN
jgi:hypothetical protein